MDVRLEVTFKVNALRGFISRMKLQVIQLERQIATRSATRKSLHHRQFRLRQLAKLKVIGNQEIEEDTTKKLRQDVMIISDELLALAKIHDAYLDCIRRKEDEMGSLLIKTTCDLRRRSTWPDVFVCWVPVNEAKSLRENALSRSYFTPPKQVLVRTLIIPKR